MIEQDIQSLILIYVTSLPGSYFERRNTGAAKYKDSSGKERLVKFGVKGAPDVQGTLKTQWGGQAIAVEVKSETGRQKKDQKQWQENFERGGGIYILARSVEDVKIRLMQEGLI